MLKEYEELIEEFHSESRADDIANWHRKTLVIMKSKLEDLRRI